MTALDELRKLIDTYNPASSQRTAESMDAHHELALLAYYHLRPAFEALERVLDEDGPLELAFDQARAVLAKLEEAMK